MVKILCLLYDYTLQYLSSANESNSECEKTL